MIKKFLSVLLTLVMAVCLINMNFSYTKAEEVEEEIEEEVEENEIIEIHNPKELISFIEKKTTSAEAKLVNDITYKTSSTEEILDVNLRGTKTLDLNGYSITFKECLSLGAKPNKKSSNHILNIINNNTSQTSTLRASKDLFGSAMIATRLYKQKTLVNTTVNIGVLPNANVKNGKIVFDGRNVSGIVGVVSGYHSVFSHEEGYYNNNLSEINISSNNFDDNGDNIVFKNFKSNSELKSMALACADGVLNVNGAVIKDSNIGVASGRLDSVAYTGKAETTISKSKITGCDIGVANGMYIGNLLFKEIESTKVYVNRDTEIYDNVIGAQFHKDSEPENEDLQVFAVGKGDEVNSNDDSKIYNNGIDYYCSDKEAIYEIKKLPTDVITRFAVDTEYWDTVNETDIPVANLDNSITSDKLFTFNKNLIAKYKSGTPNQVVLSLFGSDPSDPKAIHEKGDMIVTKNGVFLDSFVVGQALDATAHIDKIGYDSSTTNVEVFDVNNDYEVLTKDSDYVLSSGSTKVTFKASFLNKLSAGKHDFWILINDSSNANYPFKVTVTVNAKEPDKKDESCEKVIGPTWHWNNKKGICEDTGVVKTYTR